MLCNSCTTTIVLGHLTLSNRDKKMFCCAVEGGHGPCCPLAPPLAITEKIGAAAHHLTLSADSKIHDVFHVFRCQ